MVVAMVMMMVMVMMVMTPVTAAPPYLLYGSVLPILLGHGSDRRTVDRSGRSNGNRNRRSGGKRDHGRA
jgi:hypothetical protein